MSKGAAGKDSLERLVIHLLHRAVQRGDEIFGEEIGETNLTARQYAVLASVAQSENPSQTDLVETTGIDRSTLADLVRRLVRKGLLQRRRRKDDARAYAVRLTDAGHRVLELAERAALRADARVTASLAGDKRRAFIEALKTIRNS